MDELSEQERETLMRWSRWGSDTLSVCKRGGRWWIDSRGGPPSPFRTKRKACAWWDRYIHILIERDGYHAQRRAVHDILDHYNGDKREAERAVLRSVSPSPERTKEWARGVVWEHYDSWQRSECMRVEARNNWPSMQ